MTDAEREVIRAWVHESITPYMAFAQVMARFAKDLKTRALVLPDGDPANPAAIAVVESVEHLMLGCGLTLDGKVPERAAQPPSPITAEVGNLVTHYAGVGNVTRADFSVDRLMRRVR